jgi:hypothetical protein
MDNGAPAAADGGSAPAAPRRRRQRGGSGGGGSSGSSGSAAVPPVLVRLFGASRVQPLRAALRALLATALPAPLPALARRGDGEAYRQLLSRVLVATPAACPPLPRSVDLTQHSPQCDVVQRAADALTRGAPGGGGHVLCAGDGPRAAPPGGAADWTRVNAAAATLQARTILTAHKSHTRTHLLTTAVPRHRRRLLGKRCCRTSVTSSCATCSCTARSLRRCPTAPSCSSAAWR